jgi:hypothetical protein
MMSFIMLSLFPLLYSIPSALYQIFDSYKPISSSEFTDKLQLLKVDMSTTS